jgi:RNA polymerase sigma-70 factor (ECF subfamily)
LTLVAGVWGSILTAGECSFVDTSDFDADQLIGPDELRAFVNPLLGEQAKSHDSIGEILNACRAYLLVVANAELSRDVAGKISPSDVVQETLIEAHQAFPGFQGRTQEELLAWLRQILRNNVLNAMRRYRQTASRQVAREIRLAGGAGSTESGFKVVDPEPGPRSKAIQEEEERRLAEAVARLPPDYRDVIELRNREHLTFAEVGERIGRSDEAARKLWARAIEMLRAELR